MKWPIIPLPLLVSGLFGLVVSLPAHSAEAIGTVSVKLPAETAEFKQGPGVEAARNNCAKCHSADYIYMQPPLTKEQWQGTVTKMKKVFGAPIEDKDIPVLVNYLMSQNGKK